MRKSLSKRAITRAQVIGIVLIIVIAIVAGVVFYYFTKPVEEKTPIKIGIIGPLRETEGMHMQMGAILAVEEINAKGGVLGRPLELVYEDSGTTPMEGVLAFEKLVTVHKVSVVIGEEKSELCLAEQEVMADHKVIFLSVGAANPELCARVGQNYERYKYYFRISPVNSTMLGQYIFKGLPWVRDKIKALGIENVKVAIIGAQTKGMEPIFEAAEAIIPELGMEHVGTWRVSPTATDLTSELLAIKESGAHLVLTMFSEAAGVVFSRQRGELEIPVAVWGINSEAQKAVFWESTLGYGNYECLMNTYWREEFIDKYMEKWGEYPTYCSATYEAIYIWADSVERAGTLDPDAVVQEIEMWGKRGSDVMQKFRDLHDGVGMNTAPGCHFEFTSNHDVMCGPGYVEPVFTQWIDGELKCVWPESSATAEYQIPPYAIDYWRATGQIP